VKDAGDAWVCGADASQLRSAARPVRDGLPPDADPRVSEYEVLSGRPVFLLRSPDGITWVMQTFTDHVDHGLTESELPNMAKRLTLPGGWAYKAQTLDKDLAITTDGLAHIVSDDLANMYQGCVDGVASFDPWG
jgi:hypothetical protein